MSESMRNLNAFAVTIGFQTSAPSGHLVGPKTNHTVLPDAVLTYDYQALNGQTIRTQCLTNGFEEVE